MARDQPALLDLLGEPKLTDVPDRIRVATEALHRQLIDAEAAAFIGAAPFERTPDRVTRHNGTRLRTLTTTALRLAGTVLIEQHDEWDSAGRYFSEHSTKLLTTDMEKVAAPKLAAA